MCLLVQVVPQTYRRFARPAAALADYGRQGRSNNLWKAEGVFCTAHSQASKFVFGVNHGVYRVRCALTGNVSNNLPIVSFIIPVAAALSRYGQQKHVWRMEV